MTAEETKRKESKMKAESPGPIGSGMMDMMRTCCSSKGDFADCSTMMKAMINKMRSQSCCEPKTKDTGPEEGKNERADQ